MSEDIVLEDLPYDELRDRAFAIAEERRDVGFFIDLFNHTPAMHDASDEGGSLGDISGSLVETVRAARRRSAATRSARSSRCSSHASPPTSASTRPAEPPGSAGEPRRRAEASAR